MIPLKPPGVGKTRLGADADLARAIALDTVEAAAAADSVSRVIVITADTALAADLDAMGGIEVVAEPRPAGIASAIALGLAHAQTDGDVPRAALLGDLPGLIPAELDDALERARGVDRAFVPDADGSGTTMVTARGGIALVERFGPGSAAAHRAAGLVPLDLPPASSVRWDVDDPGQLAEVAARRIGPRTTEVLAARSAAL